MGRGDPPLSFGVNHGRLVRVTRNFGGAVDRIRRLILAVCVLACSSTHAITFQTQATYQDHKAAECGKPSPGGGWSWCSGSNQFYPNATFQCPAPSGTPPAGAAGGHDLVTDMGSSQGGATCSPIYHHTDWVMEPEAPDCEDGRSQGEGHIDGSSSVACVGGCEVQCYGRVQSGGLAPGCPSTDIDGGGFSTWGFWKETGATCGLGGGDDDEPPDPDACVELGSTGFTFCRTDPPGCVRSPAGAMLCPNIPGPDCATAPSGAACSNQSPPEGYEPPRTFTVCPPGETCVPITVAPPSDDDDDDDDAPPDCPANDPNCEDDEDDDPPDDPPAICNEQEQTVCDLLREIRQESKQANVTLSASLEEHREANHKLNVQTMAIQRAAEDMLRATGRVQTATDSVRNAVNTQGNALATAARATTTATQATKTAVDAVATAVGTGNGKLDSILQAVRDASTCGGVGEPSCSIGGNGGNGDMVSAINTQGGNIVDAINAIGDDVGTHNAGEGATQADTDAVSLNTINIGVGDIDTGGFGLGSACPAFPTFTLGGVPWEIDGPLYCSFLDIVNAVMMLAGAVIVARILMGD